MWGVPTHETASDCSDGGSGAIFTVVRRPLSPYRVSLSLTRELLLVSVSACSPTSLSVHCQDLPRTAYAHSPRPRSRETGEQVEFNGGRCRRRCVRVP